jgi:tachykinin-like receptor
MDVLQEENKISINMKSFNVNFSSYEQQILLSLSPNCIQELLTLQDNATHECISQFIFSANKGLMSTIMKEDNDTLNITTFQDVDRPRPFIPNLWIQLVWTLVFGIMVFVAFVGNVIVIYIVLAHRRMRTVTNFFLLNLTIADLATVTFNAIFNFVFMLNSHWPFGQTYCVINNFIANLTMSSSVFTITATSFDR